MVREKKKEENGRVETEQTAAGRKSSRQGAKPGLPGLVLLIRSVESAFALLLEKVTKHIPPQTFVVGLGRTGKIFVIQKAVFVIYIIQFVIQEK